MKKYFSAIIIVFLVCIVLGCSLRNTEEEIKTTITKYYQGLKDGDIDAISSCIDDEYSDNFYSSKSELLVGLTNELFFNEDFFFITFTNINIFYNLATVYVKVAGPRYDIYGNPFFYERKLSMIKRGTKWLIISRGQLLPK